jgi:hypothetical protein
VPDVDSADDLRHFFEAIQQLNQQQMLLAYHDRSDGGLFATLCEMAFAGRAGITVNLDILVTEGEHASDWGDSKNWASQVDVRRNDLTLRALFAEELGAVIQVRADEKSEAMNVLREHGLGACSHIIGKLNDRHVIEFTRDAKVIYQQARTVLHRYWARRAGVSLVCVTIPPAPMLSLTASSMKPILASRRKSVSTWPRISLRLTSLAVFVLELRFCVSRVSTRMSRPRM